ncbi:MAG: YfhO family protein, partial [Dehalococcoidia bacterium]|nr:YfhO family protein [Dehalococcoidia bacterium]
TDVVIYENTRVLPRAFLVPNAYIPVQNTRGIYLVNFLAEGPFDPRREVVFEYRDAPPMAHAQQNGARRAPDPTSRVVWEDSREMAIRLRVTSGIDQYLVVTDTYYPGWRARVNGVETPIHRANYLFRGIVIPAGEHVVEFTYEPPLFWLGFQITLGVAVGVIAAWAIWKIGSATARAAQVARGWHRRGGRWRTLPIPPPLRRRVPPLRPQWPAGAPEAAPAASVLYRTKWRTLGDT